MKYNFDEIIERRSTNAMNTDGFREYIFKAPKDMVFPYKDEEFVRMWVADMEFATSPEIIQAIKDRADKLIFGYSKVFDWQTIIKLSPIGQRIITIGPSKSRALCFFTWYYPCLV